MTAPTETRKGFGLSCSHRQQVEANVVKGLRHGPVHAVRQLRGHGMHILEHCSQQDAPPSRLEESKLRNTELCEKDAYMYSLNAPLQLSLSAL